ESLPPQKVRRKLLLFFKPVIESSLTPNPFQRMKRIARLAVVSLALIIPTAAILAGPGIAYPDPPGGWTYVLNGDQAVCGSGAFDSLDGTWNRSNGSSEWDCSAIGGTIQFGNFP